MRVRLLLGMVLMAGATYFAVFGGDYDIFDVRRVRAERSAEEVRAVETRVEVERLRARRDSLLSDPATIERVARERYGMIRDGERLYRFAEPPAATDPDEAVAPTDGTAPRIDSAVPRVDRTAPRIDPPESSR